MDASVALAIASAAGIAGLAAGGLLVARRLQAREEARALQRQQQLHAERLAAIGSLAAGVLKDIASPIAAIDGYARGMVEAQRRGEIPPPQSPEFDPALIVGETRRLGEITHLISGLAQPPARGRELLSLNDIVGQALAVLRYAPPVAGVSLVATLDPQLPAVPGQADRLLLLVTDLVERAARSGARRIEVATRAAAAGPELEVGGDAPVQESGDLLLVRTVAQEHGWVAEVNWNPQSGTRIRVGPRRPIN